MACSRRSPIPRRQRRERVCDEASRRGGVEEGDEATGAGDGGGCPVEASKRGAGTSDWLRANSRVTILARAVAAEVTRRKCFSRQRPPPYVGGYHSLNS